MRCKAAVQQFLCSIMFTMDSMDRSVLLCVFEVLISIILSFQAFFTLLSRKTYLVFLPFGGSQYIALSIKQRHFSWAFPIRASRLIARPSLCAMAEPAMSVKFNSFILLLFQFCCLGSYRAFDDHPRLINCVLYCTMALVINSICGVSCAVCHNEFNRDQTSGF